MADTKKIIEQALAIRCA